MALNSLLCWCAVKKLLTHPVDPSCHVRVLCQNG